MPVLGLKWHGVRIVDGAAPDLSRMRTWSAQGQELSVQLHAGRRVVVNCIGGLGRADTVASMLLTQTGEIADAESEMLAVRKVRAGAIGTAEQEQFTRRLAESLSNMDFIYERGRS